ncbi:hypothetical protein Phi10:1_gp070 [Cellulophaga phage phi10:1]|uniref:Uncharacterized protein n=1 Tax=Cellulophaga phage phi10:1 TaxID=1327981 RepID=R9ZZ70_9CAUD|nr:hypothetical protein Phi10:1_gp070 [Cellulophaga phage phi10:1]AGO48411.1 hypothetical protein Phi10:1_gp070 [Cellulophaga phage phi10:1]
MKDVIEEFLKQNDIKKDDSGLYSLGISDLIRLDFVLNSQSNKIKSSDLIMPKQK